MSTALQQSVIPALEVVPKVLHQFTSTFLAIADADLHPEHRCRHFSTLDQRWSCSHLVEPFA